MAAPSPTAAGPSVRPYRGEAVVAYDQELATLNWFVPGGDDFVVSMVGQGYFVGVQEIDGFTLELIPELVTELPSVANGGVVVNADGTMTVTSEIRDEVVWSDGVPISGADFQFTLDTIMNPDLPIDRAFYDEITDSSFGDKTFEYTVAEPTVDYALRFGIIIPKHAVEGTDFVADWNDTMWPSGGPFIFDEWQKGESIKLVRNNNYWKTDPDTGRQLPHLDSVIFRFIPDTESIINAFRAREVDIIQPPPAVETMEALQELTPQGAVVEVLSGPVWEHLNFQFGPARLERNPESANANLNYRKGVAHSINKQVIVDEILAGQVEPLNSFVAVFTPLLSQDSWAQYDYNIDTAKAYFETAKTELGVDTLKAAFLAGANDHASVRLAELLVDMFADVGVEYENQLEDSQLFFGEILNEGRWDLGASAFIGAPGFAGLIRIHDMFDPDGTPPDGQNFYRWGTPDSAVIDSDTTRFAEIRDALNATLDDTVLVPLIHEAEGIIADQVVVIPLYQRLVVAAVWGDKIGGFKHNPTSANHTWNIEDWYRADL